MFHIFHEYSRNVPSIFLKQIIVFYIYVIKFMPLILIYPEFYFACGSQYLTKSDLPGDESPQLLHLSKS
jgi:hypothetical protein